MNYREADKVVGSQSRVFLDLSLSVNLPQSRMNSDESLAKEFARFRISSESGSQHLGQGDESKAFRKLEMEKMKAAESRMEEQLSKAVVSQRRIFTTNRELVFVRPPTLL